MARISEFKKDTEITVHDKVLGSDVSGATRNYTFEDIARFFTESNAAGAVGQFNYTSNQGSGSSLATGQCDILTSSGTSLANVTSVNVSEFSFGNASKTLANVLTTLNNKDVLIVQSDDPNNYGLYTAGSISDAYEGGSIKNLPLTLKSSNGSLESGKVYAIASNAGDVDKHYVHTQGSAATTWTVNHGLNKFPAVTIKFSSGATYTNVGAFAGITYTDANNLTINLAAAESGTAYFN